VVTGVAAGTLSATSFQAVNGSQLFATNTNITNNTAAITALQGDVVDLQAQDIVLANRIRRADRRASGGTAVAIAMGGAMFLPDKTFNLTGNLGLYRSKLAGAVNLGALIGSSAAFNAGVGSGFNHNGKVGARAGFTFGW
jgi:trimeric autotransporter adhesin